MKWIILVLVVATLSGCLDRNCYKFYAFEFPLTVTPKDTFTIGDTIWWEMDVTNQLLDHNTGDYIDLTNFEVYFSFFISKADSTLPVTGISVANQFTFVQQVGVLELFDPPSNIVYLRTLSISEKRLRFGIVPHQKGTFNTTVGWSIYYMDLEQNDQRAFVIADDNCREYLTKGSTLPVNNGNSNFYLVKNICKIRSNGTRSCYGPEENHELYGGYAFHVKEP